jgi:hypothetical protein
MKRVLVISLFLCLSFISVYAESGPPIPAPKISISEAVKLVKEHVASHKEEVAQFNLNPEEFIIVKVEYKYLGPKEDRFKGWKDNGIDSAYLKNIAPYWLWEITIVHPIMNDLSITYRVLNDKKVIPVSLVD